MGVLSLKIKSAASSGDESEVEVELSKKVMVVIQKNRSFMERIAC